MYKIKRSIKHCCKVSNWIYVCERGFSVLTYLKSKYRRKLNFEDDLRLYLSKLGPNIDQLCQKKQAQPSH